VQSTKVLRRLFVFKGLSQIQLAQFNKVMEVRQVPAGTRITEEGATADCMYILLSGQVRVLKRGTNGEETVATLGASEHFGEIALIDHAPRSASVEATTDSELSVLARDAFERILREFPEARLRIYENFLESLCDRLRAANENLLLSVQPDS